MKLVRKSVFNNKEHKEMVSGCEQEELVLGHFTGPSLAMTGQ